MAMCVALLMTHHIGWDDRRRLRDSGGAIQRTGGRCRGDAGQQSRDREGGSHVLKGSMQPHGCPVETPLPWTTVAPEPPLAWGNRLGYGRRVVGERGEFRWPLPRRKNARGAIHGRTQHEAD